MTGRCLPVCWFEGLRSISHGQAPAREAASATAQGGGDYQLVAPSQCGDYGVITSGGVPA